MDDGLGFDDPVDDGSVESRQGSSAPGGGAFGQPTPAGYRENPPLPFSDQPPPGSGPGLRPQGQGRRPPFGSSFKSSSLLQPDLLRNPVIPPPGVRTSYSSSASIPRPPDPRDSTLPVQPLDAVSTSADPTSSTTSAPTATATATATATSATASSLDPLPILPPLGGVGGVGVGVRKPPSPSVLEAALRQSGKPAGDRPSSPIFRPRPPSPPPTEHSQSQFPQYVPPPPGSASGSSSGSGSVSRQPQRQRPRIRARARPPAPDGAPAAAPAAPPPPRPRSRKRKRKEDSDSDYVGSVSSVGSEAGVYPDAQQQQQLLGMDPEQQSRRRRRIVDSKGEVQTVRVMDDRDRDRDRGGAGSSSRSSRRQRQRQRSRPRPGLGPGPLGLGLGLGSFSEPPGTSATGAFTTAASPEESGGGTGTGVGRGRGRGRTDRGARTEEGGGGGEGETLGDPGADGGGAGGAEDPTMTEVRARHYLDRNDVVLVEIRKNLEDGHYYKNVELIGEFRKNLINALRLLYQLSPRVYRLPELPVLRSLAVLEPGHAQAIGEMGLAGGGMQAPPQMPSMMRPQMPMMPMMSYPTNPLLSPPPPPPPPPPLPPPPHPETQPSAQMPSQQQDSATVQEAEDHHQHPVHQHPVHVPVPGQMAAPLPYFGLPHPGTVPPAPPQDGAQQPQADPRGGEGEGVHPDADPRRHAQPGHPYFYPMNPRMMGMMPPGYGYPPYYGSQPPNT